MSRAPPFPMAPNRYAAATPAAPTQPLSINRPPSRPVTPSSSRPPTAQPPIPAPNVPTLSPTRPARSGLRSRVTSQASTSSVYAASNGSTSFEAAFSTKQRTPMTRPPRSSGNGNTDSQEITIEDDDDPEPISQAQIKALQAFKQAGVSRAGRRDDDDRRKEKEKEDSRQRRMRDRTKGSRSTNGSGRPGDLDSILEEVTNEWGSVQDDEFNPVDLALFMLSEQNQGNRLDDSFRRTRLRLEKALKSTIDKNYRAFEAALPHHSSLTHSLGITQGQVGAIRTSLQDAKESIATKRADLVQLWSKGQQVEEMVKILDQIEYLKSVPDTLETLMSEKRLLPAAALLVSSLKIMGNENMKEINALCDLKSYLDGQETSLRDILIEELNSHLYLKTFWCDSRWASYTPNQQNLPAVPFEEDDSAQTQTHHLPSTEASSPDADQPSVYTTRLSRYLHTLSTKPNESPYDLTTESRLPTSQTQTQPSAPESDSFTYIEHVLESLAILGKLSSALEVVSQRLPTELYNLVENTINEVNERAENVGRMSLMPIVESGRPTSVYTFTGGAGSRGSLIEGNASGLRLTALEMSVREGNKEILRDLFWTLYSKLDAVIQGFRVVSEVANRIGSRRNFKDGSDTKPGELFRLDDQWTTVQVEMRSLLQSYLVDEQTGSAANRNPIASISEILRISRERGSALPRGVEQVKIFRFGDSDLKSTSRLLKENEDELTRALRETVPGLANAGAEMSVQSAFSSLGTDDRLASHEQHRLLLAPDVFHVGVLFHPTLVFLDRVCHLLPSGTDSAQSARTFLEEFVLHSYLPQLEERVETLFHMAVSGPDAFREDTAYRLLYPQPLVKASVQIVALINTLCAMLQTAPFHKEKHARLILGLVVQFYQHCSDHFRDLVARESEDRSKPPIIIAAQWAQDEDLASCLSSMLGVSDDKALADLDAHEWSMEMSLLGSAFITEDDILPSIRDLGVMCQLYCSLTWFIQQLTMLRSTPDLETSAAERHSNAGPLSPATPNSANKHISPNSPHMLQLPLSRELADNFNILLHKFKQLSDIVLFSIRLDVRCRVIGLLSNMFRKSNFRPEREPTEPDPYIVELNDDIAKCDEATSNSLPETARRFVYQGIRPLISRLLITNSKYIRLVNENGARKMQRNILALQQNLKTLQDPCINTDLDSAKRYWMHYFQTPEEFLSSVRQKRGSFEECESMLNFICGVENVRNRPQSSDLAVSSYLIELHEIVGGDSPDES